MTRPDARIVPLHRGAYDPGFPRYVRPISHEHKAHHDPNAAWLRDGVSLDIRQPSNLISFEEAKRRRADLDQWLNRPGKRFGFHPPVDWIDLLAKLVIVAGLGASVALVVSM